MVFRNVTLHDLDAINEIENICFPKNEAATKESIKKRIEVFPEHFWILEHEGAIVGYINGMVTDHEKIIDEMFEKAEMHNSNGRWQSVFGLAVSPDYRNSGFAGQLINYLKNESKKQGKSGITLTCKTHLINYYKNFGFIDLGVSSSNHGGETWHNMTITF